MNVPSPNVCPKCGERGGVTNTRARSWFTWRRYECPREECGHRWSSFETVLDPKRIRIRASSDDREVVSKPRA